MRVICPLSACCSYEKRDQVNASTWTDEISYEPNLL
jgi:quinol monooxygenase YgiN